ncbi:hypothetical protein BsWGS_01073 [Bradybaena similaris]
MSWPWPCIQVKELVLVMYPSPEVGPASKSRSWPCIQVKELVLVMYQSQELGPASKSRSWPCIQIKELVAGITKPLDVTAPPILSHSAVSYIIAYYIACYLNSCSCTMLLF